MSTKKKKENVPLFDDIIFFENSVNFFFDACGKREEQRISGQGGRCPGTAEQEDESHKAPFGDLLGLPNGVESRRKSWNICQPAEKEGLWTGIFAGESSDIPRRHGRMACNGFSLNRGMLQRLVPDTYQIMPAFLTAERPAGQEAERGSSLPSPPPRERNDAAGSGFPPKNVLLPGHGKIGQPVFSFIP